MAEAATATVKVTKVIEILCVEDASGKDYSVQLVNVPVLVSHLAQRTARIHTERRRVEVGRTADAKVVGDLVTKAVQVSAEWDGQAARKPR